MTRQTSCLCAFSHHSSKTFSFELNGEKIDPNLISQSNGKEKEDDHLERLNSNCSSSRPCNKSSRRTISFKLNGEKIDPNLVDQSDDQKEKVDDHVNIGNSLSLYNYMEDLDAFNNEPDFMDSGYLSDGHVNGSRHYIHDKNKGSPWTIDEHKSFLMGLEKLGKGRWRGISEKYVKSRTATQVASHAQKYFNRIKAPDKGRRRSSLFDMSNESISYGDNNKENTYNNPECPKKVHFDLNLEKGGFCTFNNRWEQLTSLSLFIPQPLPIRDGSSHGGVESSKSKEEVSQKVVHS